VDVAGVKWWPTVGQQREKVWQVEPAPEELFTFAEAFAAALGGAQIAPEEKAKEVFVWGVCEKDGRSCLYSESPYKLREGVWETPECDFFVFTDQDNLFPKDKPQKFKLVPVEEEKC
jgi:hypothetical protein